MNLSMPMPTSTRVASVASRPKLASSLALVVSGLVLAACGRHAAAPAPAEAPPLTVRVAVAERGAADRRIELAGTVEAETSAAVSSRVAAMVTAVHVALGDEVRAGQTLISIDPTAAEGQAAQARGGQTQAAAALALAQRNFERYQALAATQSASPLELDLARTQLEQAKGAVEQAKGAVAAAQSVARESRVVAPFAGRVAARLVDVGDLAAPGRPLVMIESTRGRRLVVAVPETLARQAALAPGGALAVTLDADGGGQEIAGRIAEISPGPDPGTHSYTVKIDLPPSAGATEGAGHAVPTGAAGRGAPTGAASRSVPTGAAGRSVPTGAAGRAWLPTAASVGQADVVRVPRTALIESGGLTLVVVRDAEGRAQSRVVTVGDIGADGRAEILSGLAGGESVVLGLSAAPAAGTRLEVEP